MLAQCFRAILCLWEQILNGQYYLSERVNKLIMVYTYVNKYISNYVACMHSGKVSITIIYLWNHNLKYNDLYIYDEHSF